MTARKRFKRRVRDRAAKTGESYAVARANLARRLEQEPNMAATHDPTRFASPQGIEVDMPHGWRADTSWTDPTRIATFVDAADPASRTVGIMVGPIDGRSLDMVAENIRGGYERPGVGSVAVTP